MKLKNTGTFRVCKGDNQRWFWNLLAPNEEVILRCTTEDGFSNPQEATDDAKLTSKLITENDKQCVEKFKGEGKHPLFFRLLDSEGKNQAVSEGYKNEQNRKKGIQAVMKHGKTENIKVS